MSIHYDNNTVKEYVKEQKQLLKEEIDTCYNKYHKHPTLGILQVGNNSSSNSYVKGKLKDCEEVGIIAKHHKLEETITEEELLEYINIYNNLYDGVIVQLPLPKHINVKKVQLAINPKSDVDGFHPMSEFKPCTPLGVINFLKSQNYDFEGKNAVVIGRSDCVGKPLAQMLTDLNATVTLCHSKSDCNIYTEIADIIFTCINKIEYFSSRDLEKGGLFIKYPYDVIDIGLGVGTDGKLHGNLQQSAIQDLREYSDERTNVVSGIGGVGLLTRLTLLENTFKAFKNNL